MGPIWYEAAVKNGKTKEEEKMTKKRGNGEGSIYEHVKNGKQVGYRGAYTVHTAKGPKCRYVRRPERRCARSSRGRWPTGTTSRL